VKANSRARRETRRKQAEERQAVYGALSGEEKLARAGKKQTSKLVARESKLVERQEGEQDAKKARSRGRRRHHRQGS